MSTNDEGYVVTVDEGPIEDTGTVVVFKGVTDEQEEVTFGVDHITAQVITDTMGDGDNYALTLVEDWQILSRKAVQS